MDREVIYGIHTVAAVLDREPERFIEVYALKGRQDERLSSLVNMLRRLDSGMKFVSRKVLDNECGGGSHQGIVAYVQPAKPLMEDDLERLIDSLKAPFLLVLDGVTDPHNLGACMRSADAAGVDAIIVPKDKSASLSPTTRKTASGAAETIPLIRVTNLARTLRMLQEKNIWLVGAAGEAKQDLYESKLSGPLAIVMGSEGKGLRSLTREHCDQLLHIPLSGSVSSLNVSVATGVFLFEAVRQRQAAN